MRRVSFNYRACWKHLCSWPFRPNLVAAYSSLKKELAERFTNNRTAYTDGKTHFVTTVLDKYKS
ncbi:GrpB family protein [Paenibacillus alvei]|uniref:GrpB family protein n=1 Tax=Paenibacillus alvei TaxID=44250 RepID=UPI0010FF5E48|nr:GrpB family protein [Paenibacillus alvei]